MMVEQSLLERQGEPAWEIARLFPNQGLWSEEEYLALETNRPVEFSHGYLEVLPMPPLVHQFIVLYLYRLLLAHVEQSSLGWVLTAPLPVRLWPGKYREPDVLFIAAEHSERMQGSYPEGADLVIEVVSGNPEDHRRDLVIKRKEYAQAGIIEYWLVDPEEERITVLHLEGEKYAVHGEFTPGAEASSVLLDGFTVPVADVFAAAKIGGEDALSAG